MAVTYITKTMATKSIVSRLVEPFMGSLSVALGLQTTASTTK